MPVSVADTFLGSMEQVCPLWERGKFSRRILCLPLCFHCIRILKLLIFSYPLSHILSHAKIITLTFEDTESARELFGPREKNLRYMMTKTGVDIQTRSTSVFISAESDDQAELVRSCMTQLYELVRAGHTVYPHDVDCALRVLAREPQTSLIRFFKDNHFVISPKKTISPRTITQRDYLAAIRKNDLTFGIGPAETGKTYLAVAVAVSAFLKRSQTGCAHPPCCGSRRKLGFLPGDLVEKSLRTCVPCTMPA